VEGARSENINWIDNYAAHLIEERNALPLYARWAGVFVLASVMKRNFWVMSNGEPLFPNLYIFLVGPAAAGKGVVIKPSAHLLAKVPGVYLGADSTTAAGLADEFVSAEEMTPNVDGLLERSSCVTLLNEELSVLIGKYDPVTMNMLTKVWDNGGFIERKRKLNDRIELPNVSLSICGGITPINLRNDLPEGAWDTGFMSRVICVYEERAKPRPLSRDRQETRVKWDKTIGRDLRRIATKTGEIRWTEEAFERIQAWHLDNGPPIPQHPRLLNYLGRRTVNLMKLAMIVATGRESKVIALEDLEYAMELLFETEARMPRIFASMQASDTKTLINEVKHFVLTQFARKEQPVPAWKVLELMLDSLSAWQAEQLLETMVKHQVLIKVDVNKIGACYKPGKNISPARD
jgi:hypothetical protein